MYISIKIGKPHSSVTKRKLVYDQLMCDLIFSSMRYFIWVAAWIFLMQRSMSRKTQPNGLK